MPSDAFWRRSLRFPVDKYGRIIKNLNEIRRCVRGPGEITAPGVLPAGVVYLRGTGTFTGPKTFRFSCAQSALYSYVNGFFFYFTKQLLLPFQNVRHRFVIQYNNNEPVCRHTIYKTLTTTTFVESPIFIIHIKNLIEFLGVFFFLLFITTLLLRNDFGIFCYRQSQNHY